MKFWILFTFICSTQLSIAAMCSASEHASSFDDLIKLAGDGIAVSDELLLPANDIKMICLKTTMANRANKNSFEVYKKELIKALDKNSVPYTNIEHFLTENLSKIVCKNRKSIRMRDYSSIFKYAIDTTNYRFIRDALFIEVDGKKVCNPNIDFAKKEFVNGKNENLLDFIEELSNDDNVIGGHTKESLSDLQRNLRVCIKRNA